MNSTAAIQLLHVVGNIGAGKSTVTELLAAQLAAGRVDADDFFQNSERLKRLFLSDTPRWAFTVELSLAAKRVGVLRRELATRGAGLLVVDGGVMMSWAHARARFESGVMSEDEWEIFREVFDELVWEDVRASKVVVVSCSLKTILQRIRIRATTDASRSFEPDAYTRDYLSFIEKGIQALQAKMIDDNMKVLEVFEEERGDILNNSQDAARLVKRIIDWLGA